MLGKVKRIHEISKKYNVEIKAAALQFSLANPLVAAVIPGASRPSRIEEDCQALEAAIAHAFWEEMRQKGLSHLVPLHHLAISIAAPVDRS